LHIYCLGRLINLQVLFFGYLFDAQQVQYFLSPLRYPATAR
jgi:hypothetical protein